MRGFSIRIQGGVGVGMGVRGCIVIQGGKRERQGERGCMERYVGSVRAVSENTGRESLMVVRGITRRYRQRKVGVDSGMGSHTIYSENERDEAVWGEERDLLL